MQLSFHRFLFGKELEGDRQMYDFRLEWTSSSYGWPERRRPSYTGCPGSETSQSVAEAKRKKAEEE